MSLPDEMSASAPIKGRVAGSEISRGARRWLIRELLGVIFVAAILFLSAGRLDWWMGWALVALYAVWVAANALILMPRSPALLAERVSRKRSPKTWDNLILSLYGLLTIGKLLLAGLDMRFGWTTQFSLTIQIAALIIAATSFAIMTWAMTANAYFSTVNRIQVERGHTVASGGPYRYVRHPGYAGSIAFELATPLALGSWWALIPGGVSALLMLARTVLEDRTLREELSGYTGYTRQTRYRLLPGVW